MTRRLPTSRTGLLPWLDWRFSLLLPLGVLLALATLAVALARDDVRVLTIAVHSNVTNDALGGAIVQIEDATYQTEADGTVRVAKPTPGTEIEVSLAGYRTMRGAVQADSSLTQRVPLQPAMVQGKLRDAQSGDPIAGATVHAVYPDGSVIVSSTTADDGSYLLKEVPSDATLRIDAGDYGTIEESLPDGMTADFALTRQVANGRVLDADGQPLQGAIVKSGERTAVSTGDGTFELTGIAPGAEVTVVASGYEDASLAIPDSMEFGDIALDKVMIKGVYANKGLLGTPGGLESLIEIANTTEINAIVVDIKEYTIFYDSQVQFFRDAGTVEPIYDANEVIAKLRENDIYIIARLVVFQDPFVAEARPDLAVKDSTTGDLWRNDIGLAWVDAFHEEVWDANIALALEALSLGFDEIQYDYVRFPSDGDLGVAQFSQEYNAEGRQAAITEFVRRSYEAIHAVNGKLSADLFGYITLVDDEQYIGQRFTQLEPYLDYISMMIYPSHFSEGNIASAPGHPNDYPYETIYESLERAEQLVPGSGAKFRPWLQDFNYGGMRDYTAKDIRAQIDAAEDFGASGWLLWGDPFNVTVDALAPETGG